MSNDNQRDSDKELASRRPLSQEAQEIDVQMRAMTPAQWAYLTPQQQWQHIAQYGMPPDWYPQSVYAQQAPMPQVNVSQSVVQSVIVRRDRHIAHGLHLVLTILTGGLWGFVWLAIVIFKR